MVWLILRVLSDGYVPVLGPENDFFIVTFCFRPIPDKEFVEAYIKAFYLNEVDMENWVKEHKVIYLYFWKTACIIFHFFCVSFSLEHKTQPYFRPHPLLRGCPEKCEKLLKNVRNYLFQENCHCTLRKSTWVFDPLLPPHVLYSFENS